MNIVLYKNGSDNNVLNKSLSRQGQINVRLKEPVERETPVLLISGVVNDSYDYLYIPEWDRYYYVESKRQISENVYMVEASIDVLMSFKSQIRNASALVTYSESVDNNYFPDAVWKADVRTTNEVINMKPLSMDDFFLDTPVYVLITAGAVY